MLSEENAEQNLTYTKLKSNILKFTDSLCNNSLHNRRLSRYLYWHGDGGIGKTHLAHKLCEWIEGALGKRDIIHVEEAIITSPSELEGSNNHPGVFLKILRNQCLARKTASIVVMDEASWINKEEMNSAAKRVFNGRLSKLSTAYFGSGADGAGIDLEMPPTLVILAANVEINDPALKSRYDVFPYPTPRKEALVEYGKTVYQTQYPDECDPHDNTFEQKIEENIRQSCTSFREVESLIPALMLKHPRFFADPQGEEKSMSAATTDYAVVVHNEDNPIQLQQRSQAGGSSLRRPLLSDSDTGYF